MSTFLYFAYGSNMSERRLQKRVDSAKVVGTGGLKNHCLTFHKVSKDESRKMHHRIFRVRQSLWCFI